MRTRDVIVLGASMGGIEALSCLVEGLDPGLPAALLVVQHTSTESPGMLAQILNGRGPLPAVHAENGMPLRPGHIYVAPPNRHLLVREDQMRVVFGPRENRTRPAIDPLFRTAAVNLRSRVVGVVLTGLLGDGAAGLLAIHRCGGLALVQDPEDAAHPDMPLNALQAVPTARRVPLAELPTLLARIVREPAPEPPPVPEALRIEVRLTERAMATDDWNQIPGSPTRYTCPECQGAIQRIEEDGLVRFRCRVGHAYSPDDLLGAKAKTVEDTLWVALQTLEERAQMLENMAQDDRLRGWHRSPGGREQRARETRMHAERLRELLSGLPD